MTAFTKRVVFTMGGKGGGAKPASSLPWPNGFKLTRFPSAGLDAFVDHLDNGTPIILADMGAGAGQVAAGWFDSMRMSVRYGLFLLLQA